MNRDIENFYYFDFGALARPEQGMKLKEKKSMIFLPIIAFLAWFYWEVMEFNRAISTPEERMEPEIEHPRQLIDYVLDGPLYILIGWAMYLLWRLLKSNMKQVI